MASSRRKNDRHPQVDREPVRLLDDRRLAPKGQLVDDLGEKWMLYCHISGHQEAGMMAVVSVN